MATSGAQPGNKNASKNKVWSDLLRRLAMRDKKQMEALAKALIDKAKAGDVPALKELGDRIEGKIPQAIEGTGEGGAITLKIASRDAGVL